MVETAPKQIPVELVQFLVVDDHAFVRHIVGECLKSNKIKRFTFAQDGAEALQMLRLSSPKGADPSIVEMVTARPDIAEDLFPTIGNFKAGHPYCVITDFNMEE